MTNFCQKIFFLLTFTEVPPIGFCLCYIKFDTQHQESDFYCHAECRRAHQNGAQFPLQLFLVIRVSFKSLHGNSLSYFPLLLSERAQLTAYLTRCQCFKTVRNLRMFVISQSVQHYPFQPDLICEDKARSLPQIGASKCCLTFGQPYLKTIYQAERPARDKHSSLLRRFVNYGRKRFITLGKYSLLQFKLEFEQKTLQLSEQTNGTAHFALF